MNIGSTVIYQNRESIIVWVYKNNYCEIREKANANKVELVHLCELIELK